MTTVTYYRGFRFDPRTAAMIAETERLFGRSALIVQGAYNAGVVGASAGTHDGGGAVDWDDFGHGPADRERFVAAARTVGFAAWWRAPLPGVWGSHYHAVAIQPGGRNDQGVLSLGAWNQVKDYYAGRDGLRGDGIDPHRALGIPPTTWEQYGSTTPVAPPPVDEGEPLYEGTTMLISNSSGGTHKAWYVLLPNGNMLQVTNDEAKTWQGPRLTILNTPRWNKLALAYPVLNP